jgi:hypothetical protein
MDIKKTILESGFLKVSIDLFFIGRVIKKYIFKRPISLKTGAVIEPESKNKLDNT